MNASLSEDSVAETALAKKNSDGKHTKAIFHSPKPKGTPDHFIIKGQPLAVQYFLFSLLLCPIGQINVDLKSAQNRNSLAIGPLPDFKSTNVELTANNLSVTVVKSRRWSNMFSLSPRHQGLLGLTDYANNTSSTDNSNSTSSSTSSHEIATHPASASHEEATPTEIGAISAALPVMMCGLSYNHILSHTPANELKNSVDDGAELQRVAFANFGTEYKALKFFSHTHASLHLESKS